MVDRIFISRRGTDAESSSWIASTLEAHGYECVVQERDFEVGEAFPLSMMDAFENCETTIAVMSPDYWKSRPCRDEWAAAYALDRAGEGKLIPIMLKKCVPPKLAAALAYLDLTSIADGEKANSLLLAVDAVVKGRTSLPDVLEPDTVPMTNSSFFTPNFTGRSGELAAVHEALWGENGAAAVTTPTAIHGLGGVGKSAIAREYARRHLHRYAGAWLVRAEQSTTLMEDLAALATILDPRLAGETNISRTARLGVVEAQKLARATGDPFLLILDNIELPKDVPEYVHGPGVHTLITTRFGRLGRHVSPVEISELPQQPAETLLLNSADRQTGEGLHTLLQALNGLPLALVQAGAYLRENPSESFAEYLQALERRIAASSDDWPNDQKLVAATFEPSIERAERSAPGAAEMLFKAAFFDTDDIPIALLTEDHLAESARKAADALSRYSLVKSGASSKHGPSISLHRLLQAVLRANLNGADRSATLKAAAERLRARFSGNPKDVRNFPIVTPLTSHVVALGVFTPDDDASEALVKSLNDTARFFEARAEFAEAEPLFRRALRIREQSLGLEHPNVATSLNNLAVLLKNTNRVSEAEPLCRRALSIRERRLGPNHPDVATVLNNLALILQHTNRANEAEPVTLRALEIREQSLGPDHPDVATVLNNLALLLQNTNRACEAEPICRRALEIRENKLGSNHPDVAKSLNNLAVLLKNTNRVDESEPLFQRALAICETVQGPDHLDVAASLNNLALLRHETNRPSEAEPLYRRALAIREQRLGPDHPDVAAVVNNLALLLQNLNDVSEAEPLFRRALHIREKSLGSDHPDVATNLNNIAQLLQITNRACEAEPLYRRALTIWENNLGSDHPIVAMCLHNLAALLQKTNRDDEAEKFYRRSLAIWEASLVPNHLHLAASLTNLAVLLMKMRRFVEAEPLLRRSLDIRTQHFDKDHPDIVSILENLEIIRESAERMNPETQLRQHGENSNKRPGWKFWKRGSI